jgi:DNA-binding transcriptional regulator YhcF (GntR family)
LPTVRSLSVGLALNPNKVEDAYGALEREGFLNRAEGCGPRVVALAFAAEDEELDNRCHEFLSRVTADGYSLAEVLQALHVCMDRGISHGESR